MNPTVPVFNFENIKNELGETTVVIHKNNPDQIVLDNNLNVDWDKTRSGELNSPLVDKLSTKNTSASKIKMKLYLKKSKLDKKLQVTNKIKQKNIINLQKQVIDLRLEILNLQTLIETTKLMP